MEWSRGKRQLEIGANVECEELGCVVGGPFKPNKHREVRGLVWRPWINKPSGMTMRCADISHPAAPSSKHAAPRTPLLALVHSLAHLPSTTALSLTCTFSPLTPSFSLHFSFHSSPPAPCSSPEGLHPPASHLPSDSSHPSLHAAMHAWLGERPRPCLRYRPRYGTAAALSRHAAAEAPGVQAHKVYLSRGEAASPLATAFFCFFPLAGSATNGSPQRGQKYL